MAEPVIVTPEGEIDLATVATFRAQLASAMASAPAELLIDLSHVDFIDSTGLGAVVDVAHRCSGRVAVIAPRGSAAAVLLQLTGLGQVLDVFESRQTAVAD